MAEEENILQFHSEAAALFVSKEVHLSRSENLGTFQNDARHFTEASSHVERCTAHTPSKPIHHPLKARLRQCWLDDLQEQVWRPRKQGKKFKLVPPGRSGICNWILASWEELQKLSIAENTSSAVDDDQDFDRIVEDAVV
ncbi:hypothetical protein JG687_00019236 [Phytophthora cactorum]|uniref:Uncharacterized protein n=1 Tax=Phytophthora cactorum TaxID=29920 RepID=A0A8T1TMN1_9STRA|nr:hypothetical protein JG687_00019236 [Phytophthora cactorum]